MARQKQRKDAKKQTKRHHRSGYDWEAIEAEYRAGVKSNRQISDEHGVPESTLRSKAKREGWQKDLSDKVRHARRAKLAHFAQDASRGDDSHEVTDEQTIERAANEQLAVIMRHRSDIREQRDLAFGLTAELKAQMEDPEALREAVEAYCADEGIKGEHKARLLGACGLTGRAKTLETLSRALERTIRLERQAYNIDEDSARDKDPVEQVLEEIDGQTTGL